MLGMETNLRTADDGAGNEASGADAARCFAERGTGLVREASDEFRGRDVLGQLIGLAGPEVETIEICAIARGRPERRRQMMHVRIPAGSVLSVLAHETVVDSAGGAAGKGVCQRCRPAPGQCR